jgi:hypothetical protein
MRVVPIDRCDRSRRFSLDCNELAERPVRLHFVVDGGNQLAMLRRSLRSMQSTADLFEKTIAPCPRSLPGEINLGVRQVWEEL